MKPLQLALNLDTLKDFDLIARLDIIIVLNTDTTLSAGLDLILPGER